MTTDPTSYAYHAWIKYPNDFKQLWDWLCDHLGPWPNSGAWTFTLHTGVRHTYVVIRTQNVADHTLIKLTW